MMNEAENDNTKAGNFQKKIKDKLFSSMIILASKRRISMLFLMIRQILSRNIDVNCINSNIELSF